MPLIALDIYRMLRDTLGYKYEGNKQVQGVHFSALKFYNLLWQSIAVPDADSSIRM